MHVLTSDFMCLKLESPTVDILSGPAIVLLETRKDWVFSPVLELEKRCTQTKGTINFSRVRVAVRSQTFLVHNPTAHSR